MCSVLCAEFLFFVSQNSKGVGGLICQPPLLHCEMGSKDRLLKLKSKQSLAVIITCAYAIHPPSLPTPIYMHPHIHGKPIEFEGSLYYEQRKQFISAERPLICIIVDFSFTFTFYSSLFISVELFIIHNLIII